MKIIITGGAGFIGQSLSTALLQRGYKVVIFDLFPPRENVDFLKIDLTDGPLEGTILEGVDAIIHLAGRNIFGRWNNKLKNEIYQSRILGTRNLVSSLQNLSQKPRILISASAVGFYGDRGEEKLSESSAPGLDFLAHVCVDWESEARQAETLGIRTVQVRTAPVLGHGGLLAKLLPLYKLGLGGPIGSGRQWFPWIHIQDIINIYIWAMENQTVKGSINACTPQQISNKEFSETLAKVLRRPAFFKIPAPIFWLIFNDLADALSASQKVFTKKLLENGYHFHFPNLKGALEDILG